MTRIVATCDQCGCSSEKDGRNEINYWRRIEQFRQTITARAYEVCPECFERAFPALVEAERRYADARLMGTASELR